MKSKGEMDDLKLSLGGFLRGEVLKKSKINQPKATKLNNEQQRVNTLKMFKRENIGDAATSKTSNTENVGVLNDSKPNATDLKHLSDQHLRETEITDYSDAFKSKNISVLNGTGHSCREGRGQEIKTTRTAKSKDLDTVEHSECDFQSLETPGKDCIFRGNVFGAKNASENCSSFVARVCNGPESNGICGQANYYYLMKGNLVKVPNNGSSQRFLYADMDVLPTTLIKPSPSRACGGIMEPLSMVDFRSDNRDSKDSTVINLPSRSNFSSDCTKHGCPSRLGGVTHGKDFALPFQCCTFGKQCVEEHPKGGKTCGSEKDEWLSCRICHSFSANEEPLVSPCVCTGSMKYVHESCLINWLKSTVKTRCELCLYKVRVKKSLKPLNEWRYPGEKPVAFIWLLTSIVVLLLNISSIIKDASEHCSSTHCIIFYTVGTIGVVLGLIFFIFWFTKSAAYLKKWLAFNQVWRLEEKHFDVKSTLPKHSVQHNV